MRSATLIAAFASAFAVSSTAAGQQAGRVVAGASLNSNLAERDSSSSAAAAFAAAPARSRHAAREHRHHRSIASANAAKFSNGPLELGKKQKTKRSTSTLKRRADSTTKKCKSKSSSSSSSSGYSSSSSSSGSSSSSSDSGSSSRLEGTQDTNATSGGIGDIDFDSTSSFLKIGNIYAGFLPDDGSGGGSKESMADINKILPAKSAFYGRYAQVSNGKTFDGSQLYSVMDDVKESGAILQASVMPYGTWYGLTESDNRNAVAVAKVCADIYNNHGVEVWLRFAHEMNWYQTDGTYSGSVSDFQEGWKVMAAAIDQYAPETKMYWSPNVGSDSDYEKYYPKEGRVDVVGFDWYPNSASDSFVDRAKPFHDKYAVNDIIFFQGETGLHYSGSNDEKMQWVKSLSSSEAQEQMPNYKGFSWFNYDKFENGRQVDFKIIKPEEGASSGINAMSTSFFSA